MKRSKINFLTCTDGTVYIHKDNLIKVIKDMKRITKRDLLKEIEKCQNNS
jgi:hypothetical protein